MAATKSVFKLRDDDGNTYEFYDNAGTPGIYVNAVKVLGAQGTAVANLTTSATTGSLPTANGAVVINNTATPTVVELLEYCVELETKVEAILAALRTHGVIAT